VLIDAVIDGMNAAEQVGGRNAGGKELGKEAPGCGMGKGEEKVVRVRGC